MSHEVFLSSAELTNSPGPRLWIVIVVAFSQVKESRVGGAERL